ncbi:hypothetical protein V5799_005851 [Amblyomma americanum]|uniref:CCHC-type domain-containing protein n=1 Tax=Amblyomma americanum TaxID=6943 RepID=A0AAQ4DY29_AMBAM
MANFLSTTKDAIAAQISKLPGVKAVRVNLRRNVVAVDTHPTADLQPLLDVSIICGVKARAKEAGGCTCTGRVFRVDRALSTDDIMAGIESRVPVISCTRSGSDIILRFAGQEPPQEISLFKLRRYVRARLPRPLQCFQCGTYGHATAACTAKPRCLRCGNDHHASQCDSNKPRCVNCRGTHGATEPGCPRWQEERQIAIALAAPNNRLTRQQIARDIQKGHANKASQDTAPSSVDAAHNSGPSSEATAPPAVSAAAQNYTQTPPQTSRSFRDVVVGRKPDGTTVNQPDQRDVVIAALAAAVRALIAELPSTSPAHQLCAAALAAQQALSKHD